MKTTRVCPLAIATILVLVGCAPGLEGEEDDDTGANVPDAVGGTDVTHMDLGGGVLLTRVDATRDDRWIYLDLHDALQMEVDDPQVDSEWELGFRRFEIKLNGGVSGAAGVEAAVLEGTEFEEVVDPPTDGYRRDAQDGPDENEDPDYVLGEWYDYNPMTHVLSPKPQVYVIRTAEGDHFKLALEDYYDDAGTSGFPTFSWSRL